MAAALAPTFVAGRNQRWPACARKPRPMTAIKTAPGCGRGVPLALE